MSGPFCDERLVFSNPRTGEPWKPDTFSNEFLRAVKASGLPKVSFHGLCHSYASILLRPGTPLKVVSEMLGHTTTAITADLYTHVLGDLKADAADRLYAIFQRAESSVLLVRSRARGPNMGQSSDRLRKSPAK
ncbi:MAG TPA: tyrosine-type recombinase/integrase [Candidatus Cybelea sp.]|jgi:integrase